MKSYLIILGFFLLLAFYVAKLEKKIESIQQ